MKVPPKFKSEYKLENYMEWLGKFNFGVWKLADLDNWNLGNPLITKDSDREKFKDEIFKDTKYDPETHIDIKNVWDNEIDQRKKIYVLDVFVS